MMDISKRVFLVVVCIVAIVVTTAVLMNQRQGVALAPPPSETPKDTPDSYDYTLQYRILDDAKPVSDPVTHRILSTDKVMARNCLPHFRSNAGATECAAIMLDRVASEREWKFDELNSYGWNQVQIGRWWAVIPLQSATDSTLRHMEFEKMRNLFCEEQTLDSRLGSSHPLQVSECELGLELKAISILNDNYYNNPRPADAGINEQFEPTTENITTMTRLNRTKRGCIWAGEESNCEKIGP